MFVADFQNYIAPVSTHSKPLKIDQAKTTSKLFSVSNSKILPQAVRSTFSQHIEYIYGRNYFANKERFSQTPKPYAKPLQEFTKQQLTQKLQTAYEAPFTTLFDILKPKPTLGSYRKPNDVLDDNYKTLQNRFAKKDSIASYAAYNTYFQHASAA